MLNRAPIFVIGFPRGGTTLLMNILGSHPDVAAINRETHQVFYGRQDEGVAKWLRRVVYLPIMASAGQHVFRLSFLEDRRALPRPLRHYTDGLLFVNKLTDSGNRRRDNGSARPYRELASARLLAKNMTGLAFATPILRQMYPDATFIALVRDGLAICEGWTRRGYSPERAGRVYDIVCRRMLADAERIENYHLVRFEDLLAEPEEFIRRVYGYARLDVDAVRRFRFWVRESMDRDGVRRVTLGHKHHDTWSTLDEVNGFLRRDVNENQIARLRDEDRDAFLAYAGDCMQRLGYLPIQESIPV